MCQGRGAEQCEVTATLPSTLEAGAYLLLTHGDQQAASFCVTVDTGVAVWR